jgi:hypothetical protein
MGSQHVRYDSFPMTSECHQRKAYVQTVSYPYVSLRQDMSNMSCVHTICHAIYEVSIHELCSQRAQVRHVTDLCLWSSRCVIPRRQLSCSHFGSSRSRERLEVYPRVELMTSIHIVLDQHTEIRELIERFIPGRDYHNFLCSILCSYRAALIQIRVDNLRAVNRE